MGRERPRRCIAPTGLLSTYEKHMAARTNITHLFPNVWYAVPGEYDCRVGIVTHGNNLPNVLGKV